MNFGSRFQSNQIILKDRLRKAVHIRPDILRFGAIPQNIADWCFFFENVRFLFNHGNEWNKLTFLGSFVNPHLDRSWLFVVGNLCPYVFSIIPTHLRIHYFYKNIFEGRLKTGFSEYVLISIS